MLTQPEFSHCPGITLSVGLGLTRATNQISCVTYSERNDGLVFVLLLLLLGLFGSLTYCVWNKQTEVANEIADLQKEMVELQNELKNMNSWVHFETSEPSQVKGRLKRNL